MATFNGTNNNDTINGSGSADTIRGNAGNDTINAGAGADTIYGGIGNDSANGGTGNDIIYGEEGNDILHGDDGADTVDGGIGDDWVYGDAGADILNGGAGNDTLSGGVGNDKLIYQLTENSGSIDYYNGDKDTDTLILRMTQGQYEQAWVQNALNAFRAFLVTNSKPNSSSATAPLFNFASYDPSGKLLQLSVRNFEALSVEIVANTGPVAKNDAMSLNEDNLYSGNLFADNGAGIDSDIDGDNLVVSKINGSAEAVNAPVVLASGATLLVNANGSFSYDASTSALFNAMKENESAVDSFQYQISDGQGGVSIATVTLTVHGQNDAPAIVNQAMSVLENSALNMVVGQVVASDVDHDAVLNYEIIAGNEAGKFVIDAATGQIMLAGAVDFEQHNAYQLTVRVVDEHGIARDALVDIAIQNQNEAPVIQAATYNVTERAAVNTYVGQLSAQDPDGVATAYTFSIVDGNSAGHFAINASGVLTVASAQLDYETQSAYDLVIRAAEQNDPSQFSDQVIRINLNDIPGAFTAARDVIDMSSPTYRTALLETANLYDALAGDDSITLPYDMTRAAAINYDPTYIFTGGDGNDSITTGTLNDIVHGGAGNDTFIASIGNDSYNGGGIGVAVAGADTLSYSSWNRWDATNPTRIGHTIDLINGTVTKAAGAQGVDTFTNISTIMGTQYGDVYLANSVINIKITAGTGMDWLSFQNATNAVNFDLTSAFSTITGIEHLRGSAFNDYITGDSKNNIMEGGLGNDTLSGMSGNDTLLGNDGNDILIGGAGNDILNGGDGIDTADYSLQSGTAVTADLLAGTASGASAGSDTLISIENLIGTSGMDILKGDNLANVITGRAGNDILEGRDGADVFVYMSANEGMDTILDFSGANGQGDKLQFLNGVTISSVQVLDVNSDGIMDTQININANSNIKLLGVSDFNQATDVIF